MRKRMRLVWSPAWEGPVKAWTVKFIRKNKWRCDNIHSFDDLLQDAYLTFLRIEAKYPRVIEPAHFMSLYKSAMWNELHDKARYMRRKRVVHDEAPADVSEFYTARIGEMTNAGYLNVLLAEAPEELQLALLVLGRDPEPLRAPRKGKQRENLNMRLRRVMGFDKCRLDLHRKFDFSNKLKELLA